MALYLTGNILRDVELNVPEKYRWSKAKYVEAIKS